MSNYDGQHGFYASVKPTENSRDKITRLVQEEINLDIFKLDDKLHTTIIYSPVAVPRRIELDTQMRSAVVYSIDMLGQSKDTLVLKLYSDDLNVLHFKWKTLGAVPTYPEYNCHMTIMNNIESQYLTHDFYEMIKSLNHNIRKKSFRLYFHPETIENAKS